MDTMTTNTTAMIACRNWDRGTRRGLLSSHSGCIIYISIAHLFRRCCIIFHPSLQTQAGRPSWACSNSSTSPPAISLISGPTFAHCLNGISLSNVPFPIPILCPLALALYSVARSFPRSPSRITPDDGANCAIVSWALNDGFLSIIRCRETFAQGDIDVSCTFKLQF